jgi:hypothetical protein
VTSESDEWGSEAVRQWGSDSVSQVMQRLLASDFREGEWVREWVNEGLTDWLMMMMMMMMCVYVYVYVYVRVCVAVAPEEYCKLFRSFLE